MQEAVAVDGPFRFRSPRALSPLGNNAVIERRLAEGLSSGEGLLGVPRYFFHFSDGTHRFTDGTGQDLRGLGAARLHALKDVRDLKAALCHRHIQDLSGWTMTVADARGKPVFVLGFDLRQRPHAPMPGGAPQLTAPQPLT